MKFLKYLSLAAIAALAVGCSDDDAPVIKSPGVYFGEDNKAQVTLSPVEGAPEYFDVAVWRTENTGEQTVNITYETTAEGVFTVPSTVSFPAGAYKTNLRVDVDLTKYQVGQSYDITFHIGDGSVISDYGYAGTYEANVILYYTFKPLGTSYMNDPWIVGLFSDLEGITPYEVKIEQSEQLPTLYRVVNPFGKSYCAGVRDRNPKINVQAAYNEDQVSYYLEFHTLNANDFSRVYILPQEALGNPWQTRYKFRIMNDAGYQVAQGTPPAGIPAGDFASVDNHQIMFPSKTALFYYAPSGEEQGPYYTSKGNGNPALFITEPGYGVTDYTASLSFAGTLNTGKGYVAMITNVFGSDVKYARAAIAPGKGDAIQEAMTEQFKANTIDAKDLNLEEQFFTLPVSEAGVYTVGVGTYGNDNEVVIATTYISFTVEMGADEMSDFQSIGMGGVADGWVTGIFQNSAGEQYDPYQYRYQLEIYKHKSAAKYALKNMYGPDVFNGQYQKVFGNTITDGTYWVVIDATNPNCIKIPWQLPGFNRSSWGDLSIANREGWLQVDGEMTDAQIISQMQSEGSQFTTFTNGTFYIAKPYERMTMYEGKTYYCSNVYIWTPGAYPKGIAQDKNNIYKAIAPKAADMAKNIVGMHKEFKGIVDSKNLHLVK